MDTVSSKELFKWHNCIESITLDCRANIYFVSENIIYKCDHSTDHIEPFCRLYVQGQITQIHMIQETSDLLVVLDHNSIYSVRYGVYLFRTGREINQILNHKGDLLLVMDRGCFVLADYTMPRTNYRTKRINFYYTDFEKRYNLDNVTSLQINSSGIGYVGNSVSGGTNYYRFKYQQQPDRIEVEFQAGCRGNSQLSISYSNSTGLVFIYEDKSLTYYESDNLSVRDSTWYYSLEKSDKFLLKREKILCKDSKNYASGGLGMEILSINVDKDGNPIVVLQDNTILKAQLY